MRHSPIVLSMCLLVLLRFPGCSGCDKGGGSHEVPVWNECTITIQEAPATSSEKETLLRFTLENCEGAREVAVRRGDLFFPATHMGMDAWRRYVPLLEGANTLAAVAKNAEGAEAESDPVTVTYTPTEPLVTEDSAWIHGAVYEEATGAPIAGASIYVRDVPGVLQTGADGTFAFPTPAGGAFLLTAEVEGYTLAQRRVTVDARNHASVKPAYLVALDGRTETFSSSSGGSLTNTAGDVEVSAPAGAVRSDTEVSAVAFPAYRSLPGELPDISAWTQALELWPEGARFDRPVEVRVENVNGFPPGTQVPAGYYNRDIGAWEHQAMGEVTPDGEWIVFSVTHFSPIDVNVAAAERERAKNGKGKKDRCKKGHRGASIIDDLGGQLTIFHPVSLYEEDGEPTGVHLVYNSGAAAGDADVIVPVDTGPTVEMERIEAIVDFQGTMKILGLDAASGGRFNVATRFQAATPDGEVLPSGIYPAALDLTKYEYSTYMTVAYFGGAGLESTGVRTREALPYTAREGVAVTVHDLGGSAFGAGWTLDVLEEVAFNDDLGFALILRGTGTHEPVVTGLPVGDPLRLPFSGGRPVGHAYMPDGAVVFADDADDIYLAASRNSAETAERVGTIEGVQNLFPGPGGVMATNYDMELYSVSSGGEVTLVMNLGEAWSAWAFGQMGSDNPPPLGSMPDLDAGIVADREGVLWMVGVPVWGEKYLVSANLAESPVEWNFYTIMSFVEDALPGAIAYDGNEHALYYAYYEEGLIRKFDIDAGNESIAIQDDDLLGEIDVMRMQRDGRGNLYVIKMDRVMRFSRHGVKAMLAGNAFEQTALFLDVTPEGLLYDVAAMPDGSPSFLVFENYDYETYVTLADPDRGWVNEWALKLERDAAGTTVTMGDEIHRFDAQGRVTAVTDPGGRTASFTYGADGLESYTSPYGYATRIFYTDGHASEIVDPAGRARALSVGPGGMLDALTDADGRETTFGYDGAGRLTEKGGASGAVTYTYDEVGSVSRVELDTGELIQIESMLQAAQPAGIASAADAASTVTDGEGNVHRSEYGMDGLLSRYSLNDDAYDVAHSYRLDFTGWDSLMTDPKHIVTVQHGGVEVVSTTYDRYGDVLEQSLYGSLVATSSFNDEGALDTAEYFNSSCGLWPDVDSLYISCDEMTVTLYYDADGFVVQMDDGGYGTYLITNDAYGNPVTVEDPLGGVVTLTRDDAGNVTGIEDADGRITQYTYTHDNEPASVTDNLGAVWSADLVLSGTCSGCAESGRSVLQTVTDPFGRDWTATIRSDGNAADFTTPEGHVTTYTYNGNRMLTGVSREDGPSATFVYNAHDQVDSMTIDGDTTSYTYDERRLLVSASSPDFTITWDRDYAASTVVETVTDEATGFSRSLTVTYDPERGVDTALQTDSGLDLTLDHEGDRVSALSQAGGSVLYIAYAPPWVTSIDAEDSAGDYMMSQYFSLDELRRIDGIDVYAGSNWLDGAVVSYDGYADEPSSVAWSESQFESMTYGYDGVGRLTSALGLAAHSFGYDLGGRITSSAYAGPFAYDNDWRVLSTSRATYTYHASGSRAARTDALTGEHWEYDADALGFLREVRKYASSSDPTPFSTVRLFYDPLFRLSRIEEDGVSIQYQWWEWTLVGEFGDGGGVIRSYIPSYGVDGVGVIRQGGEDLYAVTDANGSVLKLIDAAQTVRASYRYDPYGRVLEALGDRAGQPRRFAGALWLHSIGLYYLRMRLMDPEIGQFTSMDALWTLQIQPYAYCGGKPTRCNDPLGMEGPSTSESASAVGKLAYDQVKGGLEGKALGPLQPLKGMYDAFSDYKPGDDRHNGSVALKKIGSVTFLDRAPWWKKIVKKVEGFWDMVTGSKKKKKDDPCKPRIGRVLNDFRG